MSSLESLNQTGIEMIMTTTDDAREEIVTIELDCMMRCLVKNSAFLLNRRIELPT